jgi:hypothetical protein
MDWNKIATLLLVVEKTKNDPPLKHIFGLAFKELAKIDKEAAEELKKQAEEEAEEAKAEAERKARDKEMEDAA